MATTKSSAVVLAQVGTVLRHPDLWSTAVRQLMRLAPIGWWRRRPFLPVPASEYTSFRMLTQYGDAGHRPEPKDVLNYLRWCKAWNRRGRA